METVAGIKAAEYGLIESNIEIAPKSEELQAKIFEYINTDPNFRKKKFLSC